MQSILNVVRMISGDSTVLCPSNCSGRGTCVGGNCVCELKYTGGSCKESNLSYFIGFGVVYFLICLVAVLQLILCVRSDYLRMKTPSVHKACRMTVQKLLYFCIVIACGVRGVYFSTQEHLPYHWSENLFTVYYAFIISGFSIIICFWAETFHVSGLRLDQPRFLNKSTIGFFIFNVFVYALLVAKFASAEVSDNQIKGLLENIFTGFFAGLMLLILVFFLIYGVELYCKLRGAYRETSEEELHTVDLQQVLQSRFGLIAQGSFQLLTALFLMGDVMGYLWKDSLPVSSRNILDVVFRIFELGLALWFPCCLWNYSSPHQLWILNPGKLLKPREQTKERSPLLFNSDHVYYQAVNTKQEEPRYECWICYDPHNKKAGPMIFPCQCIGDVAAVHHECLRRWLVMSSHGSHDEPKCKVCGAKYELEEGKLWLPSGVSIRYWLQAVTILSFMVGLPFGSYALCVRFFSSSTVSKIAAIGGVLLMECVCLKLMGFNMRKVHRRAKLTAITILNRKTHIASEENKSSNGSVVDSNVSSVLCKTAVDNATCEGITQENHSNKTSVTNRSL